MPSLRIAVFFCVLIVLMLRFNCSADFLDRHAGHKQPHHFEFALRQHHFAFWPLGVHTQLSSEDAPTGPCIPGRA